MPQSLSIVTAWREGKSRGICRPWLRLTIVCLAGQPTGQQPALTSPITKTARNKWIPFWMPEAPFHALLSPPRTAHCFTTPQLYSVAAGKLAPSKPQIHDTSCLHTICIVSIGVWRWMHCIGFLSPVSTDSAASNIRPRSPFLLP